VKFTKAILAMFATAVSCAISFVPDSALAERLGELVHEYTLGPQAFSK
jgi:hypothetical protein